MSFGDNSAHSSPHCVLLQEPIGTPTALRAGAGWVCGSTAIADHTQLSANTKSPIPSSVEHHLDLTPRAVSRLQQRDISPAAAGGAFVGSVLGFILILLLVFFLLEQSGRGPTGIFRFGRHRHGSDDDESGSEGSSRRTIHDPIKDPPLPPIFFPSGVKITSHRRVEEEEGGGETKAHYVLSRPIEKNPKPLRRWGGGGGGGGMKPPRRVYQVRTKSGVERYERRHDRSHLYREG